MFMSRKFNCLKLLTRYNNVRPQPLLFNTSAVKYIPQHPLKFMETQNKWKEKDGISGRWELIYKAPMGNILNYTTAYLTFSTIAVTCSCFYYVAFFYDESTVNEPIILGDDVVIANSAVEGLIYLTAFALFHIVVKIVLSKYVVRLYQDGDKYLAIFRGHWYNSLVKHEFHLKDFKKVKPSMIITWSDAKYHLGEKQGILLETHFKTPQYLNYLLYKKKPVSKDDEEAM